jgi:methylornithine synthase
LDVAGLAGLQTRLDAGANVVTSLVPPGLGLAGVARSSLDIAENRRAVESFVPQLEKFGLCSASTEDYVNWYENRRADILRNRPGERIAC